MSESYTPSEIIKQINSQNPKGSGFDPYGADDLSVLAGKSKDVSTDIFDALESEIASDKAEKQEYKSEEEAEMLEFLKQVRDEYGWTLLEPLKRRTREAIEKIKTNQPLSRLDLALIYRIADITDIDDRAYNEELSEIAESRPDHLKDYERIFDDIEVWPAGIYISDREIKGSLDLPEYTDGRIYLGKLEAVERLDLGERIASDLDLRSIKNAEGIIFPHEVVGDLYLNSLEFVESPLELPRIVEGSIILDMLADASKVTFPGHVGGALIIRGLKSIDGLELPKFVGGKVYVYSLTDEQYFELRNKYPNLEIE